MTWAPTSTVEAKKPIHAPPGTAVITGGVWADLPGYLAGKPVPTFDVNVESGKEDTVFIVVRGFEFRAPFAEQADFNTRYEDDGYHCFGIAPYPVVAGAYTLYEDGDAEFNAYPEFLTADAEALQKYHFYLTGTHDVGSSLHADFLAKWETGFPIKVTFDSVEITTEGKGQNRRRSCTGSFTLGDGYFFGATAILKGG
jgi:hypothetical protein